MTKRIDDYCISHLLGGLTFAVLRRANVDRCEGKFAECTDWTTSDWFMALTGEVGELDNLFKKRLRNKFISDKQITDEMIASELADIQIYLDLLAHHCGIDLGEAVKRKFNNVSRKVGSHIRLEGH